MPKVVINSCFGGFSLSPEACLRLYELGCTAIATPAAEYFGDDQGPYGRVASIQKWREYLNGGHRGEMFITTLTPDEKFVLCSHSPKLARDGPLLIQVVEEMGAKADGPCASLKIVDIPGGVKWHVEEYDGNEHVAEDHDIWY